MWIERQIKNRLRRSLKSRPFLLLTGARQSGKSSLLRHELPRAEYITLDYVTIAEEAETNPSAFLARFEHQVVLDEIRYFPALLRDFQRFIRLCAACTGSFLNYTDIAGNVGVSRHTIKSWVSASIPSRILDLF